MTPHFTKNTLLMDWIRIRCKPMSYLVMLGFLSLSIYIPTTQAALVTTETALHNASYQQDRERIVNLLHRTDVQQRLINYGVDSNLVEQRINSLTDAEVQTLNAEIDELPAGGDALGTLVFVFFVLLITDILGFTEIFPFVKHPIKR